MLFCCISCNNDKAIGTGDVSKMGDYMALADMMKMKPPPPTNK